MNQKIPTKTRKEFGHVDPQIHGGKRSIAAYGLLMTNKKRISSFLDISSSMIITCIWPKKAFTKCQICILDQLSHVLLSFWQRNPIRLVRLIPADKFNLYVGQWRTAETRRFCTQGNGEKQIVSYTFFGCFFNSPSIFGPHFLRNHFFPPKIPINLRALLEPFQRDKTRKMKFAGWCWPWAYRGLCRLAFDDEILVTSKFVAKSVVFGWFWVRVSLID